MERMRIKRSSRIYGIANAIADNFLSSPFHMKPADVEQDEAVMDLA